MGAAALRGTPSGAGGGREQEKAGEPVPRRAARELRRAGALRSRGAAGGQLTPRPRPPAGSPSEVTAAVSVPDSLPAAGNRGKRSGGKREKPAPTFPVARRRTEGQPAPRGNLPRALNLPGTGRAPPWPPGSTRERGAPPEQRPERRPRGTDGCEAARGGETVPRLGTRPERGCGRQRPRPLPGASCGASGSGAVPAAPSAAPARRAHSLPASQNRDRLRAK